MFNKGMDWDGDAIEIEKIKAADKTVKADKTAKQMMEELWNLEIEKSVEEATHDNMNPQRWA